MELKHTEISSLFFIIHCIFVFIDLLSSCFARLSLFIVEPVIHIEKINGYQIYTHNPKAEDISDAVCKILATQRNNIKVKLNPIKQDIIEGTSFEERCVEYFEGNFETLATEAPLILPCKEPEKSKEIVKTMESWCIKTNKSSRIKGLVLHSFSVLRHLEHFGFAREVLKERLEIKTFSEAPVIVVYNPQENALMLIRNAETQDLTTDIYIGLDDLKMFILLFNDDLKSSNLNIIPLVVTDNFHEVRLECSACINNVLSLKEFKDLPTFEKWWKERETYFEKVSLKNITPDFIKKFSAKMAGTVAATFIYGKHVPTLTDKSDEQMANVTVLLTREQMEIVYSQDKHIIIRGGFGCGKTIIAATMLKKISENLKNNEKLYYICYDSRSELLDQMTNVAQKEGVANMTSFHNEERRNLSEIIKDILEKRESTRKVNFIVDEYDGEDLDESEAKSLNKIFNELLKQMFIIIIVQPIEKKRIINNIPQERNKFELLETMKVYELNRVMRNSVEIHNLVKLTTDMLRKQQTVFVHPEDQKIKSELKTSTRHESVSETNTETKLPKSGPQITAKLTIRQRDANQYPKEKLRFDEAKVVPASLQGTRNRDEFSEENPSIPSISPSIPSIPKLGLDEAQALSGSLKETDDGGTKTISEFLFAAAEKTGHKISSEKPKLFELADRSDFQKVASLIAIFEKREIERSEQVVLHFDTGSNEIPDIFFFIFAQHFKIEEKIANKYEQFKSLKKSVLVCSYPTFRGLEHPKITVVIDRDIYYVQHYLAETLARCTTDLCVVALQNSSTLTEVTSEWKTKEAIQQLEIEISEDESQVEDFEFTRGTNTEIINAKFRSEYYMKMEKHFLELMTKDKNFESKMEVEARKIIKQR